MGDGPRRRNVAATAFTLIEMLIVIVVIGLLIAVVGLAGSKVLHGQKITATKKIMQGVTMALDEFAELNPLRKVYDAKSQKRTFGPFPPYQLDRQGQRHSIPEFVERGGFANLRQRFERDFFDVSGGLVVLAGNDQTNDDIRALYTYLAVHVPGALSAVPEHAFKALLSDQAEYINTGSIGDDQSLTPVLGIHDQWGVPLDYLLYVKIEYVPDAYSGAVWRVTDRIPVLRSRGVSREEYEQQIAHPELADPEDWIFSVDFPQPAATAVDAGSGRVSGTDPDDAGWARAKAAGEDYDYKP